MPKSVEIIPSYNVHELHKAIDRLNRKARKLGTAPLVLTISDAEPYRTNKHPITGHELLNELVIERKTATLEYEIPTLNGYELIARLDVEGEVVFVSAVPEKFVPAEYQNKTSIGCDHCGQNRYRTHSILIRHMETNEYMEVGSTCVKDFFGGNDPEHLMFAASILFKNICAGLNDEMGFGGYGAAASGYDLEMVLAITSASIKQFGWLSKGKAYHYGGQATADHVWVNLEPSVYDKPEDMVEVTDADVAKAKAAIEWWSTVEPNGNDYLLNCVKIQELGYVPRKYMGFACSMLPTFEREMEKMEQEKRVAEESTSTHVGNVGERVRDILVDVVFTKHIESDWGFSTLYTFKDAAGNIYKTFYSGSSFEAEKGDKLVIAGTVKKHDEFRGEKQTMLNRVAASAAPDEAFAADEFAVA